MKIKNIPLAEIYASEMQTLLTITRVKDSAQK